MTVRRTVWRGPMAALFLALVVAGCSGGGSAAPERTDPTVPPAPPPDITEIPEEITLAYVQAVARELDRSYGDIYRLVQAEGAITTEVLQRLEALYSPSGVELELAIMEEAIASGFAGFRSPIGNHRSAIDELLSADPTCVLAKASRDTSDFFASEFYADQPVATVWISMRPSRAGPTAYNRTPWTFFHDGPTRTMRAPEATCANDDS